MKAVIENSLKGKDFGMFLADVIVEINFSSFLHFKR